VLAERRGAPKEGVRVGAEVRGRPRYSYELDNPLWLLAKAMH
jgi:hypothetical protein